MFLAETFHYHAKLFLILSGFFLFLNQDIKESYRVAQSMLVYYCLPKCLINLSQPWM